MEFRVLRQIGVRSILRGDLWRRAAWRDFLPVQAPLRIRLEELNFGTIKDLLSQLAASGYSHSHGGNAVYLSPETIDGTAFRILHQYYPADAGLKIVRDPGDVATSQYVSGTQRSLINMKLTSSHGQLTMAANLLNYHELGPKLYDLVELDAGEQVWTAYVVQHLDGRAPTMEECEAGIERLRSLEKSGVVRVTLPGGLRHADFACPKCNNNALVTEDGAFHYVDFQNFVLSSYEHHLLKLARAAGDHTHFGRESVLWGGNVDQRFDVLDEMMANQDVVLREKVVLNCGCNIGTAIAQYLKRGARWCHGWGEPEVVTHTDKLLPAIGCTRFSLTGGQLFREQRLEDDLPEFVRENLNGCVISYLAVRGYIGWLDSLASIPWSYLIYEGCQEDDFDADMRDLARMVNLEIAEKRLYSDGLSDKRPLAILKRV